MDSQESIRRARTLVSEIQRLARAHDNKALLDIDRSEETETLLGLLAEKESRPAKVHLEGARIWRSKRNRKAEEKFDAASEALEKLDLVLARGILRKIDTDVLGEEELARYDELYLAIESRAVELEEIRARVPPDEPGDPKKRPRRFFNR